MKNKASSNQIFIWHEQKKKKLLPKNSYKHTSFIWCDAAYTPGPKSKELKEARRSGVLFDQTLTFINGFHFSLSTRSACCQSTQNYFCCCFSYHCGFKVFEDREKYRLFRYKFITKWKLKLTLTRSAGNVGLLFIRYL